MCSRSRGRYVVNVDWFPIRCNSGRKWSHRQLEGDEKHYHANNGIKAAPRHRARHQTGGEPCSIAEAREPGKRTNRCSEGEQPTSVSVLVSDRSKKKHGVEVDVRVEESECQRDGNDGLRCRFLRFRGECWEGSTRPLLASFSLLRRPGPEPGTC